MSGNSRWGLVRGAATIVLALGSASCSGAGASKDAGSGVRGGADATIGCTTDADCAATVPPTVLAPGVGANCAAGKCNALQGVCEYVAKDEDGDGHAAANCRSTNGVAIQEGDDCNDQDPNLYPGHPESCTPMGGGGSTANLCARGQTACLPDGTQSACTGTPGGTQCLDNGIAMCSASGTRTTPVACVNQTCTDASPDAGSVGASCQGVCAPGQGLCNGAQPQSCDASGQWQDIGAPCAGSAPACMNGVCGTCGPGTVGCNGTQPQVCNSTGTAWQNSGRACSGDSPVCASGACVECSPGQIRCSSSTQPQVCSATNAWQNTTACAGSTPACVNGACVECVAGTTQCSGVPGEWQTCGSDNLWGAAVACASGSCGSGACIGKTGTGQSCSAMVAIGVSTCGTINARQSGESCCTSWEVAGGTYYRTYANDSSGPTGEADPATISGFRLDKYDVTVGRFRQFVNAVLPPEGGTGWTPPAGAGKHTHLNGGQGLLNGASSVDGGLGTYESGWLVSDNSNISPTYANLNPLCAGQSTFTSTVGTDDQEMRPINCVNWYEAYAFCIWDGGFLPSEAEWEYSSAGGSDQREYPWGIAALGVMDQYAIYHCYYPYSTVDQGTCNDTQTNSNTAPVGFADAGAGLWGQLDLEGNAYQWTLDSYAPYSNPCSDCAYLTGASDRAIRGGAYNTIAASSLLPPYRAHASPTSRNGTTGFRCARTP